MLDVSGSSSVVPANSRVKVTWGLGNANSWALSGHTALETLGVGSRDFYFFN